MPVNKLANRLWSNKSNTKLVLPPALLIICNLFLFGPATIYSGNISEFNINLIDILKYYAIPGLISLLIFIGIGINEGRNNYIIGNSISHTYGIDGQYGFGIEVSGAHNNISYNHVFDNDRFGIIIGNAYRSAIYRNTIENNERYGLAVGYSSANTITQNNFIQRSPIFLPNFVP